MASVKNAKIRLVRCPRCRLILPELPDIPVYECGGCGIRLKAKIRKENAEGTSSLPETGAAEMNKLGHVSKGNESGSSCHGADLHPLGQDSLDHARNEVGTSYFNDRNLSGANFPNDDESNASDPIRSEDMDNGHQDDVNLSNENQNEYDESYKKESLVRDKEQDKDVNLSNDEYDSHHRQNESVACDIEQHGISNRECSSNEASHHEDEKLYQLSLPGTSSEIEANDEISQSFVKATTGVEAEADANNDGDSTSERLSQRELNDTKGSTSTVTLAGENVSSDILMTHSNELIEQQEEGAYGVINHLRSRDTFETTGYIIPSSELSDNLVDLSKSPTTRSCRAYYEDGVSSYEGTDDQLPDRSKHSSKHAYKFANYDASDVRHRRERFLVNNDHKLQHHFRSSASISPEKTHYATKYSKVDQEELQEPARFGHPVGNWRAIPRDEYMSQHTFHRREPLHSRESGSPSNHNGFYNSSFPSQDKHKYAEQEKIKLLRMVYELQEQLKEASLTQKVNGGVTWNDGRNPMYNSHVFLQEDNFNDLACKYSGSRDGSNWPQQQKFSRIPFSAEATTGRHQLDHSSCFYPQERHYSAQFSPSGLHHSKGLFRVHPHLNLHNSYGSCPSSPQQHVDFENVGYNRGTKSEDQRHRSHEVKKHLREKRYSAKRHLRPIAGGAPFITCSFCLKQLQLPADFLLFRRKYHQVKCGACLEVLKFSLVSRTHITPYVPTAEAPPPSEIDEHSDTLRHGNFTSTSHISDCPCPDSMSCTDDYGHSFSKSYSVDKNKSNGPHDEERRKLVLNEIRNKGKAPIEAYESVGSSASTSQSNKVSSEIEEIPLAGGRGSNSPLHQLMGYASPGQVIYGWGPSDSRMS